MANINDILNDARIKGCSDVHIGENTGITLRQDGKLIEFEQTFSNEEIKEMILSMCKDRILKIVEKHEDADFVYVNDLGRHRVNIYFQQGYMTAAIRIINEQIKTLEELNLPDVLHKLALLPRGLVLVTGPTGSGKSTTLAAMIDFISSMRNCHILTIEDPIEYVYQHGGLFDAWSDFFNYDLWLEAFAACDIDIDFYTKRVRSDDEIFPWDFIDVGVSRAFLLREWKTALTETVTPNCRMRCSGCGAKQYGGGVCFENKN